MARRSFRPCRRPAKSAKEIMRANDGKTVLITGAGRRIGRRIASALAHAGWDIAAHYNASAAETEALAQEVEAMGRRVTIHQANLESEDETAALLKETPPLAAIVHNASLFERDENDPDGARHRRVNFEAPLSLTNSFFETLPMEESASVVFLLDNTALPPFLSSYAASKALLRGAMADLALRYAPRLRVNAVALGPTLKSARESEEHFLAMVEATPLQRPSAPEDIAAAILFLMETRSITGEVLNVDSGANLLRF